MPFSLTLIYATESTRLRGGKVKSYSSAVCLDTTSLGANAQVAFTTISFFYQLFLKAGDPVFVTAWIPIGDCAANGGGLMYLEDSCKLGETIEKRFEVQQDKENMPREERISAFNHHMGELGHLSHNAETWAKEDGLGKRWLVADFEAGDVVFHSPWMIHASSQNNDKLGRIRLSSDLRFYEEGAKIDERWTRPFYNGDGL